MSTLVIDASVALKWVITEPGSDEASALLTDLADDAASLVAPEHLLGEVGNGLRKRVAQGALVPDDAVTALNAVAALGLEFIGATNAGFERCAQPLAGASRPTTRCTCSWHWISMRN